MSVHEMSKHAFPDFDDTDDDYVFINEDKQRPFSTDPDKNAPPPLDYASVPVHMKLDIDSDMVSMFGGAFAAARYGVELIALVNDNIFHDTGFNLIVSQINVRSS